jgi:hypothetical protein
MTVEIKPSALPWLVSANLSNALMLKKDAYTG